jgi:hypothetical protein
VLFFPNWFEIHDTFYFILVDTERTNSQNKNRKKRARDARQIQTKKTIKRQVKSHVIQNKKEILTRNKQLQ